MTRLLVSVRDAEEAGAAVEAGAQLIDVKEPSRGSLGAADPQRVAEIAAAVDGRVPLSAAWGELFLDGAARLPAALPEGVQLQYAKWGLAGAARHDHWTSHWAEAVRSLPPGTKAVAVQYADWSTAAAAPPNELLAASRRYGVEVLLVDTFDKSRGTLLDVWPLAQLRHFIAAARDQGMMIVLGGSLTLDTLPAVRELAPDYIAVRGAACSSRREGRLDARRVRALRHALAQTSGSVESRERA